jgi:PAS domain S-box-containing protein
MKRGESQQPQADDLRARAELRLAKPDRPYLTAVPRETGALIHELQLQRAELELQNDQLLATEQRLLEANQRYRELYDGAPIAYLTLDRRGRILDANRAAGALLATPPRELIGSALTRFMAAADADRFHLHRWEVLCAEGRRTIQLLLTPAGGTRTTVRIESVSVPTPHGTECRTTLIDVTDQAQLVGALDRKLCWLDTVLDAVADGVIAFDADGAVEWASVRAGRLCDCAPDALVGRRLDEVLFELERAHGAVTVRVRRVDAHGSVALLSIER